MVGNSRTILEKAESGECGIGFVEHPGSLGALSHATVRHDQLRVIAPLNHRWTRRTRPVTPTKLATTPLVIREEGSGTRATLAAGLAEALGAQAPATPNPVLEAGTNAAVLASVIAGAGPGVLSELVVADPIAKQQVVPIEIDGLQLKRPLRAVWIPGFLGPAASGFLDSVRAEQRYEAGGSVNGVRA